MAVTTDDSFSAELKRIIARVLGKGTADPRKEQTCETLFRLLGHMTRIDGRVTTEETALVRAIMIECELSPLLRERAMRAFAGDPKGAFELAAELEPYLEVFPPGSEEHAILVDNLLLLARADGRVDTAERTFLAELAKALGFEKTYLDRKLQGMRNPSLH